MRISGRAVQTVSNYLNTADVMPNYPATEKSKVDTCLIVDIATQKPVIQFETP